MRERNGSNGGGVMSLLTDACTNYVAVAIYNHAERQRHCFTTFLS